VAAALAVASTAATTLVPRQAPARVEGEGFCPTPRPCWVPARAAGLPIAFLVDRPEISVPGRLSLGEDEIRPAALAGDLAVHLLGWVLLLGGMARWRGRSGP